MFTENGCVLTEALRELLQQCVEANTTNSKVLAAKLDKREKTKRNEFERICAILGVRDRGGALVVTARRGWIVLWPEDKEANTP